MINFSQHIEICNKYDWIFFKCLLVIQNNLVKNRFVINKSWALTATSQVISCNLFKKSETFIKCKNQAKWENQKHARQEPIDLTIWFNLQLKALFGLCNTDLLWFFFQQNVNKWGFDGAICLFYLIQMVQIVKLNFQNWYFFHTMFHPLPNSWHLFARLPWNYIFLSSRWNDS